MKRLLFLAAALVAGAVVAQQKAQAQKADKALWDEVTAPNRS